jgi:queuosine precursor transporter
MLFKNELLWASLIIFNFGVVLLAYRFFGKTGLYAWMGIAVILANIQVLKTVELFALVATLGNIIYGTTFLATDILSEVYGKASAKRAVFMGFFFMLSMTAIMWICLQFIPHASDFAQGSLETIFGVMPRVALGSLAAYLVSQLHDVWAFHFWKRLFSRPQHLWIRNNLSTMVSQLIDSIIFCTVALLGLYEMNVWFQILLTTYILKLIVAAADTPFVYIARKIYFKYYKDKDKTAVI